MLRMTDLDFQKKWSASKYRVLLWRWTTSISTKLSIGLVAGLALIPVVPRSGTATVSAAVAAKRPADTKVEIARVRPEPAIEARIAPGSTAAPSNGKAAAAEPDDSLVQLVASRRRAKQAKREEEVEPTRTPSGIATEEPARRPSGIAAAETPGKVPVPSSETKASPDAKPSPDGKTETAAEPLVRHVVQLGHVDAAVRDDHDERNRCPHRPYGQRLALARACHQSAARSAWATNS